MSDEPSTAERAIVVQLLDRKTAASSAELYARLASRATPEQIDQAARNLAEQGVIVVHGSHLRASNSLRRLDALGLIAI